MLRILLKLVGVVSIALSICAIPVSFPAGNPAVLGIGSGGLLAGAILMGLARVIALLEQLVERSQQTH
jgi:hypothetical protein